MKIINKPKGAGKTIESINYCLKNNLRLVCFNQQEANRVNNLIKQMDLKDKMLAAISFDQLKSLFPIDERHNIFIDNADLVLYKLFSNCNLNILGLSCTDL